MAQDSQAGAQNGELKEAQVQLIYQRLHR